tara:strand:- start:3 stop:230 length:228 start_codon:yes stop_codon:yes gene_type:complete
MGFVHSPKIVIDNLVLCLDAANSKSYSDGDTTWTDTIGSLSGAITGATWSNNEFTFDGDNDVISIPNNTAFHFGS